MNQSKKFTDLFINRPVLAVVISLLILLVGLRSANMLGLREYPYIEDSTITVQTSYYGASAQTIQPFITEPIQKAVASAEGVDYITSSSSDGVSSVVAHIRLNFSAERAFTNVSAKVSQVQSQLPQAAQKPVITKGSSMGSALMYLSYQSDSLTPNQVSNYITQVIQPSFATVPGVAQAELLGGGYTYAMRIWLNPIKMASLGITADEVQQALRSQNYLSTAGFTQGKYMTVSVRASTNLKSANDFRHIIVKHADGQLVHLSDIAKVELGQESYTAYATYKNKLASYIAIEGTPTANPLVVIKAVKKLLPQLQASMPMGMNQTVVYDATTFIKYSIVEVIKTILEASIIVILIIYLFLGSIRSVFIPVVTIPLSLIGVMTIMLALGFSLNLLTLLAMVLAIGMVVDDAIVVLENIHRYIEQGKSPFQAALIGAREIATPVISMTITLAAVYAPIGFMTGVTGSLFTEFAFTLAATVIVSGVIALTLSPMMCSKFFSNAGDISRYEKWIEHKSNNLKLKYQSLLRGILSVRGFVWVFIPVILACCAIFYLMSQHQLAPQEDQGVMWMIGSGPEAANINYTKKYADLLSKSLDSTKQVDKYFTIAGFNVSTGSISQSSIFGGILLKPWDERKKSSTQVARELSKKFATNPGLKVIAAEPSSLPTSGGFFPINFVLKSTGSYRQLYDISNQLVKKAMASKKFEFLLNGLSFNKPQFTYNINREKAAQLGVSIQQIGDSLSAALSGGYVNFFSKDNQSFKVIPQFSPSYRPTAQSLTKIYVKTDSGAMVPLSNLVSISSSVMPNELDQFQQQNSAEIQGIMMPTISALGALKYLTDEAKKIMPAGMSVDYGGNSRVTMQEGNTLIITLIFSLIVIYLVLAAQYESFIDPIIILVSVPLSLFGALLPLFLGDASVNMYSEIGMITLIGLISKHGILMVDFANNLQKEKSISIRAAIIESAGTRLRPILMTTFAMVFGVMPLVWSSGAGAASRHSIGIVIVMGMLIGTLFTLFVVPCVYTFLATDHRSESNEKLSASTS